MGEGGYKQINAALDVSAFEKFLEAQRNLLPKLPDVEQLSSRVIRVLGQNPGNFTLQGTNTYILGTGKKRIIIDTGQGFKEWIDLVQAVLDDCSAELQYVLLSHHHGDHTKGVPDLLRIYPHLSDKIYKNSPEPGQKSICDGQKFYVEGATVRAVHGGGHSSDHVCFVLEEENAMFTGDNVLGHGTSAIEHLGLYIQTLQKLEVQGCSRGYPAHGTVILDLVGKIRTELDAKARREKRCFDALEMAKLDRGCSGRAASMSIKELVVALHGEQLNEEVQKKALEPFIEEILRKLADDGKVAFHMSNRERRWFAL